MFHGNSNQNEKLHHLYEIRDSLDDDIFKYGISHDPIGSDGLSKRCREQVTFLNLGVNALRFFGRILLMNISGRSKAKEIENEYIEHYATLKGRKPRGNRD